MIRCRQYIIALLLVGPAAMSCASERSFDFGAPPSGEAPSFVTPDASSDAAVGTPPNEFTSYCPSNKCPAEYTTCPSSDFPCDVNLLTDTQNCGACGAACPASPSGNELYECVDGRCVMQCRSGWLDCDGLPDNGCEASPWNNDSCGKCGVICSDPAKPCLLQPFGSNVKACGCTSGQYCNGQCVDTTTNDKNCATCGNACPRNGDGGTLDPNLHMYYGCVYSECGRPKCEEPWADCDGDLANGCETNLLSTDSCGACNSVCSPGQSCKKNRSVAGNPPQCMCPEGQSFCPGYTADEGYCRDFSSDRDNCGGCNIACRTNTGAFGICVKGTCRMECVTGRADCNGNEADGCEIKADSDPRNCGGCGIVCDAIAGQACVQGRCVVEPCKDEIDAGGGPQ
jgi:hypothetical protein